VRRVQAPAGSFLAAGRAPHLLPGRGQGPDPPPVEVSDILSRKFNGMPGGPALSPDLLAA